MGRYQIETKNGDVFGVYEGADKREAFLAMLADAGDEYGSDTAGTENDWVIIEIGFSNS